jgi:hypothetical protein
MGAAVAILYVVGTLGAQERVPRNESGEEPDLVFEMEAYGENWITGDTNDDGVVDYAALLDEDLLKTHEVMDFNKDGLADDFYFYENEVLVREELDTNYDGAVHLWIYMHDGVSVERWERDTDYDGTPDFVRNYGEEESDQE